jgi:hypothetical protein
MNLRIPTILFWLVMAAGFWAACAGAAEVDLQAGSSFGAEGYGPTLGLNLNIPFKANPGLSYNLGTDLWGATQYSSSSAYQGDHWQTIANNWDWHASLQSCKWRFCAEIGPAYVQRVDTINGAHTNFYLGLSFKLSERWKLKIGHLSDAGTSNPNIGRQGLWLSYRLQ